jgi:serine/threonine protein kinase
MLKERFMIGKVIRNTYRIYDEIGQGTVATVYLAKDLERNQVVALKIIHPELAEQSQFARRFRRQARLLTKLDSPHTVKVLDYGSDEGVDFIVLEYVEGRALAAILEEEGALEVQQALSFARQVAQGLAHADEAGIVHRDIRPANIMVEPRGLVKIMDFGIARGVDLSRLTATGILGSAHYLSPEQAEGKEVDIRSDIYSLGITLFEILTGRRPYEADNAVDIVLKHLQEPVPSLREFDGEIPGEVDELVKRCLAKDPEERFRTPGELMEAIDETLRGAEGEPPLGMEAALVGQTLGQYRLVERIGRGGMATVYKAYQPSLDRYVAVKVLPAYLGHDPGFAARFQREARAIARLNHPHVLPVYDSGQEGELSYIVMRYVEGGTLKERLGKPLRLNEAVEIISQVGGALDYAHRQEVIHHDVKPSNVLIDAEGWALLADFGLAKIAEASVQITKTGVGVGTPAYMSPEQGQGKRVDGRSDIYSLGIMLFEMLTGQVPFEADTPLAVLIKHLTAALPLPREINPDIPEPVERVILKAVAKAPEDRYRRGSEMVEALRRAAMEKGPPEEEIVFEDLTKVVKEEEIETLIEIVEEEGEGPDLESLIEIVEETQ